MKYLYFIGFLSFWMLQACDSSKTQTISDSYKNYKDHYQSNKANTIKGLSFVAPPDPFKSNPFIPVKEIGAGWISVIPYGFTMPGKPEVRYGANWQWWGERPEGIIETIKQAHSNGLKVMLKPQVYFPGSWPGGMEFKNEEDWQSWEQSYKKFMQRFIDIADSMNVELLCIGTEFTKSTKNRNAFWIGFIKDIRSKYNGKLTYASNWDEFSHIQFWQDLDFTGINAYFPLVDATTPKVSELVNAWKPLCSKMQNLCLKTGKPILFTEYGYLSVDGCCYNTWEAEQNVERLEVNQQGQANALDALYMVFNEKEWWGGGFLWKWFPEMKGHEGYPDKDYTPQGKLSENIVKKWFQKQ